MIILRLKGPQLKGGKRQREKSLTLDKPETERLKELIAGDKKLEDFYNAICEVESR